MPPHDKRGGPMRGALPLSPIFARGNAIPQKERFRSYRLLRRARAIRAVRMSVAREDSGRSTGFTGAPSREKLPDHRCHCHRCRRRRCWCHRLCSTARARRCRRRFSEQDVSSRCAESGPGVKISSATRRLRYGSLRTPISHQKFLETAIGSGIRPLQEPPCPTRNGAWLST